MNGRSMTFTPRDDRQALDSNMTLTLCRSVKCFCCAQSRLCNYFCTAGHSLTHLCEVLLQAPRAYPSCSSGRHFEGNFRPPGEGSGSGYFCTVTGDRVPREPSHEYRCNFDGFPLSVDFGPRALGDGFSRSDDFREVPHNLLKPLDWKIAPETWQVELRAGHPTCK